jgi:hypothetical protein
MGVAGGKGSRVWTAIAVLAVCAAPAWLFLDPLTHYRLQTDDFAYVGASRTWARTVGNLLVPHNTHVVPAWRIVSYGVVAAAGKLVRLPDVMAPVSYGILVATMLVIGRFVALETGRTAAGLVAMAALGSTSVMEASGTWFSASQTLWAALGILIVLLCLQAWTRGAGAWTLWLSIPLGWLAAGFWTLGHLAGLAGAAYLSGSPDPRRRRGCWVPLAGMAAGVAAELALKGRELGTMAAVDGRVPSEAFSLFRGIKHTMQGIPENLILGNLGLSVSTTALQGVILTVALGAAWITSLRRAGRRASPLERAGLILILVSYLAEYGFRGYKPFAELRGVAVPWYNTIPQVGLILLLAGWWTGGVARGEPLTGKQAAGILLIQIGLLFLNAPRVLSLWDGNLAPMTVEDMSRIHADPAYRRVRALQIAGDWVARQRRDLARLDQAEVVARQYGIDREAIRQAFGRVTIWELPRQYDAADMLDLPGTGAIRDPAVVRGRLKRYLGPAPGAPDPLLSPERNP